MKTIIKFEINRLLTEQTIETPFRSEIIKVLVEDKLVQLYCIVSIESTIVQRYFKCIISNGNGSVKLPENGKYIDTFIYNKLIWHLFELL